MTTLHVLVELKGALLTDEVERYKDLKRILKSVAYKVDDELTTAREGPEGALLDGNGNTVGRWWLAP